MQNKEGAKRTTHHCHIEGCLIVGSIKLANGTFSCALHKDGDVIGHTSLKCKYKGCDIQPWYGGPVDKTRTYCKVHVEEVFKPDQIIDFHKKCVKCGEGRVRYRKEGGSYDYCTNCKEEGMESCEKKCIEEGCTVQANYGKKGGKVIHCAVHSTLDEYCLYYLCQTCNKIANYGYEKRTHCAECKKADMHCITAGKCSIDECYNHGLFGTDDILERFCSIHKSDEMYDMHHKRCNVLECNAQAYKGDECSLHSGRNTKIKNKENELTTALINAGVEFKRGLAIESGQFGLPKNYQIDFRIYGSKRVLILECDESQHRADAYENDNLRMYCIANQYKHVTFIRFNPDTFRVNGKINRTSYKDRINLLLDVIKKEQQLILDDNLRIVKICYDNQVYCGKGDLSEYGIQVVNMEEFNENLPQMGMPYNP